jgi:hypothetical protein
MSAEFIPRMWPHLHRTSVLVNFTQFCILLPLNQKLYTEPNLGTDATEVRERKLNTYIGVGPTELNFESGPQLNTHNRVDLDR